MSAIPDGSALAAWPGVERREPPSHDRHYLVLKPLAAALRRAARERLAGRTGLAVLDVGCGEKPYLPLFAPYAATYRGLDTVAGAAVDDVGQAENLPYADESFDVVICTQVLEHVDDPNAVVREVRRVLRPGGLALVSTHGVFLYHPSPPGTDRDYWRWTHAGLRKLFGTAAPWQRLDVVPNGEILACGGYLLAQFLDDLLVAKLPTAARRAVMHVFNRTLERLDSRFPPGARTPNGGALSANYLVVAHVDDHGPTQRAG